MELKNVSSLWIGGALSPIEQASIKSFLNRGHNYTLYSYNRVENVPLGCCVRDGREILPESRIFSYKTGVGAGSFSACSNMFRYKLLLMKETYWVDTDVICIKQFDFTDDYVFGWEDDIRIGSAVIRAPQDSHIIARALAVALEKGENVEWGEVGPGLLTDLLLEAKMSVTAKPVETFYPIHYGSWRMPFNPANFDELSERCKDSYSLHLWNEMYRRSDFNKFSEIDPGSWIAKISS